MEAVMRIRKRREQKRKLIIFSILTLVLVFMLGLTFGSFLSRAKGHPSNNKSYKYYANIEIQPGDTLWDLAAEYLDEEHYESKEAYIEEVLQINSLSSSNHIVAGQYLVVPYY